MNDGTVNDRAISADARAIMAYHAGEKSILVAYLLWFFFGPLCVHRFYMGKWIQALVEWALLLGGWVLVILAVGGGIYQPAELGFTMLAVAAGWWLLDAFLIPLSIQDRNKSLAHRLGVG